MITHVGSTVFGASSGASTTASVTAPSSISLGDCILLAACTASTRTFTWPANFTEINIGNVSGTTVAAAYKIADGTESSSSLSVTISGAAGPKLTLICSVYSGTHPSDPINTSSAAATVTNSTSYTTSTTTTVLDQCAEVSFIGKTRGNTSPQITSFTAPSPLTEGIEGYSTAASGSSAMAVGYNLTGVSKGATIGGRNWTADQAAQSGAVTIALNPGATAPYSGVLAWNSAEGGVGGVTPSPTNSGGASGTAWTSVQISGSSTIKYLSHGAIHDTRSYEIFGNGGFAMLRYDSAFLGAGWTNSCGAIYIRMTTMPSSYTAIVNANQNDAGSLIAWRIKVSNLGNLRLTDKDDNAIASTANTPITLNTLYRIEWQINSTTSTYVVEWFAGDSVVQLGSHSGTAGASVFGTSVQRIDFGRSTTPDFSAIYDTIAINTSKLGPRAGIPLNAPGPWLRG